MKYVIRFSSNDLALSGQNLSDAIAEEIEKNALVLRVQIANLQNQNEKAELERSIDKLEERIRKNARGLGDQEKDVLDLILAAYAKVQAKASDMFGALDLADRIKDADGAIIFDDTDQRILTEAYEKATKQEVWYTKMRTLMRQLAKPVLAEKEEEKKE